MECREAETGALDEAALVAPQALRQFPETKTFKEPLAAGEACLSGVCSGVTDLRSSGREPGLGLSSHPTGTGSLPASLL